MPAKLIKLKNVERDTIAQIIVMRDIDRLNRFLIEASHLDSAELLSYVINLIKEKRSPINEDGLFALQVFRIFNAKSRAEQKQLSSRTAATVIFSLSKILCNDSNKVKLKGKLTADDTEVMSDSILPLLNVVLSSADANVQELSTTMFGAGKLASMVAVKGKVNADDVTKALTRVNLTDAIPMTFAFILNGAGNLAHSGLLQGHVSAEAVSASLGRMGRADHNIAMKAMIGVEQLCLQQSLAGKVAASDLFAVLQSSQEMEAYEYGFVISLAGHLAVNQILDGKVDAALISQTLSRVSENEKAKDAKVLLWLMRGASELVKTNSLVGTIPADCFAAGLQRLVAIGVAKNMVGTIADYCDLLGWPIPEQHKERVEKFRTSQASKAAKAGNLSSSSTAMGLTTSGLFSTTTTGVSATSSSATSSVERKSFM